jgi:hypothetical protein
MIEIKNRWTGALLLCLQADNLSGADLSDANLSDANLSDANLSGANLSDANLSGANLSDANLSGANLSGADLSGANLSGANLSGADLSGADLSGANLSGANLSGADLSGADLSGANLSGADLRGANLSGADLSGANLSGADLSGADLKTVLDSLGIQTDPTLPARILAQVEEHPETWNQETWHCDSKHCIYGWATELSGPLGKYMDRQLGTFTAATLLLWRPGAELPSCMADATEGRDAGAPARHGCRCGHRGGQTVNYKSIGLADLSWYMRRNYHARSAKALPGEVELATMAELRRLRDQVEHLILCCDSPPYFQEAALSPSTRRSARRRTPSTSS